MKAFVTASLAALIAITAALPATIYPAEARNRGAKIAAGVILGAAALAIIANSKNAQAQDSDDGSDHRLNQYQRRCKRLEDRCNDGSQRACDRYEDACTHE
jgi:hypothetical protein